MFNTLSLLRLKEESEVVFIKVQKRDFLWLHRVFFFHYVPFEALPRRIVLCLQIASANLCLQTDKWLRWSRRIGGPAISNRRCRNSVSNRYLNRANWILIFFHRKRTSTVLIVLRNQNVTSRVNYNLLLFMKCWQSWDKPFPINILSLPPLLCHFFIVYSVIAKNNYYVHNVSFK